MIYWKEVKRIFFVVFDYMGVRAPLGDYIEIIYYISSGAVAKFSYKVLIDFEKKL